MPDPHTANKKRVNDVSFTLHSGEIVGLFGLVGAGRTELAQAIFGAWPGEVEGTVRIDDREGRPQTPREAINRGIGMLTENRKQTGLIEGQSVLSNVSAASLDDVSGALFIDERRERARNGDLVHKLDVRPPRLDMPVDAFSGGNQQKILLARWLATDPRILILDEPTFGVDVGARFELYRLIRRACRRRPRRVDDFQRPQRGRRGMRSHPGHVQGAHHGRIHPWRRPARDHGRGDRRRGLRCRYDWRRRRQQGRPRRRAGHPAAETAWRRVAKVADGRVVSMLLVFVLLCIFFHAGSRGIFFQPRNLSLLLRQASIVAVVSAGVSILMVMGEIDLSIGSAVFLCSVVAASLQVTYGVGTTLTVLLTIITGLVLGALQGILVVRVSVPSFIVTLAGLLAFRGIGYYATDASTIAPVSDTFSNLSEGFIPPTASYVALAVILVLACGYIVRRQRGSAKDGDQIDRLRLFTQLVLMVAAVALLAWIFGGFLGIPMALLWMGGTGLVLWVLMTRSKFGRNAYMIGSNCEAAVLAGIALSRQLFVGFLIMGVLYGIAGVLITARLGASTPSTGTYMELDAIAGAVIGGTSLRGGVGTVAGAMVGSVLLATIDNGMSILNVSSFIQLIVKGVVLVVALAFDAYMIRHRTYRA